MSTQVEPLTEAQEFELREACQHPHLSTERAWGIAWHTPSALASLDAARSDLETLKPAAKVLLDESRACDRILDAQHIQPIDSLSGRLNTFVRWYGQVKDERDAARAERDALRAELDALRPVSWPNDATGWLCLMCNNTGTMEVQGYKQPCLCRLAKGGS